MIRIRERSPLVILLAGVVLVYIAGTSLYAIGVAHGDTLGSAAPAVEHVLVSAGPVVQAAAPTDTVAIVAAILGGLALVVTGLHAVLAVIAPKTKTTIDDTLRDDLAALLAMMRGLPGVPPAATTTTVNVAAPTNERGSVTIGMLAILLLGGVLGMTQVSCSGTTGQRASTAAGALLDCESPQLVAAALAAGNLAQAAILSTISGAGHPDVAALKATLTGIKDAGLMCAVNATIAMLATPTPKQPGAAMAAGLEVDGDELRAAFARARVELGWPAIKAAGQ